MALTGWTNRGLKVTLDVFFRGAIPPTDLYVALVTAATAPTADINTLSELTEIAAGNGYTAGGLALNRDSTDWDTLTQDDTFDEAYGRAKDVSWTASGGAIPTSGDGASYAVLTDDNVTVGSREVFAWWDLGLAITASVGETLTLADLEAAVKHTELTYLFLARFETDRAAPIGTPLVCELGELAVSDTGNNLSISGGLLVAANSGSWTPRLTADSVHARAVGLTTVFEVTMPNTANDVRFGLCDTTADNIDKNGFGINPSQQRYFDALTGGEVRYYYDFNAYTAGQVYRFAVCLRAAGALFLVKGGTEFPEWTLLMVTAGDATTPLHEVVVWRTAGSSQVATIETAQLTDDLASEYGVATARTAVNVAEDTLTAEADALLEWTFTAVNAQTHSLELRRSDADNLWRVDCDVLAQSVRLIRREAAVETVEDEDAITLTPGSNYRLVVGCLGSSIRAWIAESGGPNVEALNAFNATATGVKVNTAGTNLIAWPRALAAAEAQILDAMATAAVPSQETPPEEPPVEPPVEPPTQDVTGVWTVDQWESKLITESYDRDPTHTMYQTDHTTFNSWSLSLNSYDHYGLAYGVDGNIALYEATGKLTYLARALNYAYNVKSTAKISSSLPLSQYKDSFLGWASSSDGGTENPLREGYLWRHITRMMRIIYQTPAIHSQIYSGTKTFLTAFNEISAFHFTNVWTKWRTRGMHNLYASRTHMASHWAYQGMELWHYRTSLAERTAALEVMTKFNTDMSPYRTSSMRGQLYAHPIRSDAFAWNSIWGKYTLPGAGVFEDDWSHHQACAEFIFEANRLELYWTDTDIAKFVSLVKNVLWNKSETNPQLYAYLKPEQYASNLWQGGTIKLAAYDAALMRAMQNYRGYTYYWTQLYGNGALAAKIIRGG